MSKAIDHTFKRYGKLVATARCHNTKNGKARWLCICDCGEYNIVSGSNLIRNNVKSCGCTKRNEPAKIDYITGRPMCCKCKVFPMTRTSTRKQPNSGWCNKCKLESRKRNRSRRWESGERHYCRNHPLTFVNRAAWITSGGKLCASCNKKRTLQCAIRTRRKYGNKIRATSEYKEYRKYYDLARKKTLKLRSYGN